MSIENLHIDGFRCIERCNMALEPGVNCIVGDNASGKTTLLEAVYVLGRGESFRHPSLTPTIKRNVEAATLRSILRSSEGQRHQIAARIQPRFSEFKFDSQIDVRRLDLITALPLQLIDPNVHRLLEQGPKHRRQYLDWGVFHVEQAFFPAWRRYRRALKQRNRSLRARHPKRQIIVWDNEIVSQGEIVDACRRRFLNEVQQRFPAMARELIGSQDFHCDYQPGWRGESGFGAALAKGLETDIKAGFTQQGPHRADIRLSSANAKVQDWVSRGQQKILSTALLLVQVQILNDTRGIRPILLIDDMAAELGEAFRDRLATELLKLDAQCLITFLDYRQMPRHLKRARLFHVEQGNIKQSR